MRRGFAPAAPTTRVARRSLLVRTLYFVLIGRWFSWIWANAAAVLAVTIVGLPVANWTFNRLPFVTSAHRFDG